jgi:hypothetical protein
MVCSRIIIQASFKPADTVDVLIVLSSLALIELCIHEVLRLLALQ